MTLITRHSLLILLLLFGLTPASASLAQPAPYIRADNLGVTFVAYTNNLGRDADRRYQQALEMGVGWNRYPIYWNAVETSPGIFNWGAFDQLVEADRRAGLRTNAILLGRPEFHKDGGSITRLYEPIFSDGTDIPAFGKQINPGNPWARFVFEAVNRYRPGGVLARQLGWNFSEGITVWEAWNEPDLDLFWQGSKADYARLLQVAYIAAHHADNGADVMFGGLAYGNPDTDDWLRDVLTIYAADPNRAQYNWYMDIVGLHSYNNARRTGLVVARVKATLAEFGINPPVWVNETGVPVWNDYPGPTWAAVTPSERRLLATTDQQAAFVMQSAAYAFAAGADKVFFHQMYDDCGDSGGDFPPDSGQAGEAFGFYRNPRGYPCYSQHPLPGTPRPAVGAFRTTARLLGNVNFAQRQIIRRTDGSVFVQLWLAGRNERVTVLWSERPQNTTITWTAESSSARLYGYNEQTFTLVPDAGLYTATLPPARLNDDPTRPIGDAIMIGGETFMMVEQVAPGVSVAAAGTPNPAVVPPVGSTIVTPRAPLPGQIGSVLGGSSAVGAVNAESDINPPLTGMEPLPEVSAAAFTVRWNGSDAGGIERYLVWVRVNDGEWRPWFEGARNAAEFTGVPGERYAFAVWAVDYAGNWSLNTDLRPQAQTRVD